MATAAIAVGEPIVKYEEAKVIREFARAHPSRVTACTSRCSFARMGLTQSLSHDFCAGRRPADFVPESESRPLFSKIRRADGRVGHSQFHRHSHHRELLGDGGSARSPIASKATRFAAYPNVDGVAFRPHASGCGTDNGGEGMRLLQRTIAGYARHPNFAGFS